uniref:FRIGIDA-like protein n=1 Tax=Anthurium amnicola TaxID=1678845 RepID=A0A1D1XG88_9ARAE
MASTTLAPAGEAGGIGGGESVGGGSSSLLQEGFEDMERKAALMTSCTLLWKELTDHFAFLERDLQIKSEALQCRLRSLDRTTQQSLESLHRREQSIDGCVDLAVAKAEERRDAAVAAIQGSGAGADPASGGEDGIAATLRALCTRMDFEGFWEILVSRRKEVEAIRQELPTVLSDCVDPAKFVMEAMSKVFPVDKRAAGNGKSASDLGWACVMILEALIPVLADPELGSSRPLITPSIKGRAKEIANTWKDGLELRGGVESAKPPDVHTFLQHVVTFGIVMKEDKDFYRKLVLCSSWRKQMPKLALSLGLGDIMMELIEELIGKGQQLDAVNFAYEAGLEGKYPPVPLLKVYLNDSKKAATSILEDRNNSGRAMHLAGRKEQSALRAVIKCIEDRKLEADFPPEGLQKRLEELEKVKAEVKAEKKRPISTPANKRTRANSGGPMPPAKAGRLTTRAHVSSFPSVPAYIRSPSAHSPYHSPSPPYAYERPAAPGVYGSRSPQAIRDPYAYPQQEVPPALGVSYPGHPVNYPMYGGYSMSPYQHAYY